LIRNDEFLSKLISKIEPKVLENLPFLIKEHKNIKSRNFRILSAPSEKYLKGLLKCDLKNKIPAYRDKSLSIFHKIPSEKKILKRNCDSVHDNCELLATFNPNSRNNLLNFKEEAKKILKAKEFENAIDCSNTPSFHRKNSYESSISTNVDYSFRNKKQKFQDFSFMENLDGVINEGKKKSSFPKNLFQFTSKKNKFFV